jgi:putative transposase
MLRAAIEYKVIEAGGIFVEVPTLKVKPSQTCPKCGHQRKKALDERVHQCEACGFTLAEISCCACNALVGTRKTTGAWNSLANADVASSTSGTVSASQQEISSNWDR